MQSNSGYRVLKCTAKYWALQGYTWGEQGHWGYCGYCRVFGKLWGTEGYWGYWGVKEGPSGY